MNLITVLSLYAMVLITSSSRISAEDVPDRVHSLEYRKPLFGGAAKNAMSKRSKFDDVKYFEAISESSPATTSEKPLIPAKRKNSQNSSSKIDENNYDEIKMLLTKLLDKIGNMEKYPKRNAADVALSQRGEENTGADAAPVEVTEPAVQESEFSSNRKRKVKDRSDKTKKQRWGKWTNWSPCSVSCGKGREIRWRHCLEHCEVAETEMEEKTCQLPACGPAKLFGVIKL